MELLRLFLSQRQELVERIHTLLSGQGKAADPADARRLSRDFEDCFFTLRALSAEQTRLRGQLQQAHWDFGFRPREMPGLHNDLIDPAQMMIRGCHLWQQTRWPGRNGRMRYAHTLFNLYLLRNLELLVMRLWDAGAQAASERLVQVQELLTALWRSSPADQPHLVRDARWLIPVAQSPTTEELAPYFRVEEQIAASLTEEDRVEIFRASVQMAGGHLRSQLRHYCIKNRVPLDEHNLLLITRNSNALDFAILVQGLVPLLEAYGRACREGGRGRLALAGAICQGISADPELFVNRIDLLGPYTMIEHVFIATRADSAQLTPLGQRHVRLLQDYAGLMGALAPRLHEDCRHFRPVPDAYSPYGVIYGFSSNLTEHMALKTLTPEARIQFSIEDVFAEGSAGAERLAWVDGWRKLPHIKSEVQRLFDYPQRFAEEIFARIEQALAHPASAAAAQSPVRTGRVQIAAPEEPLDTGSAPPALPLQYRISSDPALVSAHAAHARDEASLLNDRREGMFAVSYRTSGGWAAITKDFLTEVLGAGQDVRITGLPRDAAAVLSVMCLGLSRPALP